MRPQRKQTSVRLSPSAVDALNDVSAARSLSRDATVRALLNEYINRQEKLGEDVRLAHMSTVLRFPPPPLSRTERDNRVRVAMRLDAGVAERASSLALRLPGQPHARGPRHYSPRPLTDALAVAIASGEPYTDDGLEDLPAVVSQGVATGLWRLAVAATLTRAEQRVLLVRPDSELAWILNDEDIAWHSPWRFEVALHLARRLLAGPDRSANLEMLQRQVGPFQALRHDLARTEWPDSELMRDCTARPRYDHEGRGGAAVWRAERKLAIGRFADVLTADRAWGRVEVSCPGWTLEQPSGWTAVRLSFGQHPSIRQRADLDERRVLLVQAGSRSAIWPYDTTGDPIPRFDVALASAPELSAASLAELVLLSTEVTGWPWVPSELASEWGLMSPAERTRLEVRAAANRARAARAAVDHWHHSDWLPEALERLVDDPRRFTRLAREQGVSGGPFRAGCFWEVQSVAETLTSRATDEQVRWLVHTMHQMRTRALEAAMQRASQLAYWHGRPPAEEIM